MKDKKRFDVYINGKLIKGIKPFEFNEKKELLRRDAQEIRFDKSIPKQSNN